MLVGHLLKTKKELKNLKKQAKYIYRNSFDKTCFQQDIAYGNFRDLARITASDKGLGDKVFNIAKSPKCDGCQRSLASMEYKCFDKKLAGSGVTTLLNKSTIEKSNYTRSTQVAKELHKPIIRKFKTITVYSAFKDNISGVDLTDMQSISKLNKGVRFLSCVIDIFSKYASVVPLKDKKGVTIVNAFQEKLDDSKSQTKQNMDRQRK